MIITYRRPQELARTLGSVRACDPPPEEILVVDGDPNRSAEVVCKGVQGGLEPRYLSSPPSLSIQRNRGIDEASGDVLVFLDDDVDLDPDVFALLREVYSDPTVVGATGRIVEENPRRFGRPDSKLRRVLFPGGGQGTMTEFGYPRRILDPGRPGDVEWMEGCFSTARVEKARHLRFDENITAELEGEDEDFAYRLSSLGRIRYDPRITVRHRQLGFRTKSGSREFDRDVVVVRTYLFRKNFRATLKSRLQFAGLIAVLFVHRLLNQEWRGAIGIGEGVIAVYRRRRQPLLSAERTRAVIAHQTAPSARDTAAG